MITLDVIVALFIGLTIIFLFSISGPVKRYEYRKKLREEKADEEDRRIREREEKEKYEREEKKKGEFVYYIDKDSMFHSKKVVEKYKNSVLDGYKKWFEQDYSSGFPEDYTILVKQVLMKNGKQQGKEKLFKENILKNVTARKNSLFMSEVQESFRLKNDKYGCCYHTGAIDDKGKRDGEWVFYDQYGEAVLKIHYENGKIVKIEPLSEIIKAEYEKM